MTSPRALYVYAVVSQGVRLGQISGVEDAPVEVVVAAGLGLLVSEVDVTLLAEVNESGATRLGDLARRHDAVVREALSVTSSVLPFRLGTVVPGREAVERLLTERAEVLTPALRHVETCWEWGVTVHSSEAATQRSSAPAGGTGVAYLARRRQELSELEERRRRRAVAAAEVAAELRSHAVDAASGAPGSALFAETYLVRRESEGAFFEAIDRCGGRLDELGLRLQPSGPWPPYSFVPRACAGVGS